LHPPNSFSLPLYQPAQTAPLFYPLPHPNRPLTCPQPLPPFHPHLALPYCHQLHVFQMIIMQEQVPHRQMPLSLALTLLNSPVM
jgi:hypothetical protein